MPRGADRPLSPDTPSSRGIDRVQGKLSSSHPFALVEPGGGRHSSTSAGAFGSGVDGLGLSRRLDGDLSRLGALAHRNDHREDAALVRRADLVDVYAVAERE